MRERILDAAYELLMEQGPDALSIRAIADRVGVSHMVLYTYFENHEALAQALRARFRAKRTARVEAALRQAASGDVAAVMREALNHYTVQAKAHPQMFTFMWVQPASNVPPHNPYRLFQSNVHHLAQLVKIGIERGVFVSRDPMVAAATAFAIILAPLLLYYNGRLVDANLRDQMSAEALEAALQYLLRET